MGIMRMGYAHVRVTDLDEAKGHYANTMGLYETCLLYTSRCV